MYHHQYTEFKSSTRRWTAIDIDQIAQAVQTKWDQEFHYYHNDFIPFVPLRKPLNACRVALVTTGGLYMPEDPPFDDAHPQGDASFRAIADNVDPNDLRTAHSHYDHRYVDEDRSVMFPLSILHELVESAVIASTAARHYSFMGFITRPLRLIMDTAPEVAQSLRDQGVDIVLLSPG